MISIKQSEYGYAGLNASQLEWDAIMAMVKMPLNHIVKLSWIHFFQALRNVDSQRLNNFRKY